MKKIHLLAMLLFTACVVPVSQAQESLFLKDPSTKNKLLQLDLVEKCGAAPSNSVFVTAV